MATAARQSLSGWRNEMLPITIVVAGADLTAIAGAGGLRMQVRAGEDVPGSPLVNLATVTSASAEGLKLVTPVPVVNGLPTSTITGRINKTTMQALPYSGEVGDDTKLAYAIQIDGVTRLFGDFWALASAIDSDGAPINRPASYGSSASGPAPSGALGITISDQQVITLDLDGTDLLGPLLAGAQASAALAGHYANDATDLDVPGGAPGERGAKYWSLLASTSQSAAVTALSQTVAAKTIAQQAANDSGSYLAGVQAAVGGIPTGAQLPLQASSRAIMAGFTGQTAGRQAFLSETGREGVFAWMTGDQSAGVTADPYQALYVPPASDVTGASGAWHRAGDVSRAEASWAGVVSNTAGATDNAARLNSLLSNPEVAMVRNRKGVTYVEKAVVVPGGKTFWNENRAGSSLRPTAGFALNGEAEASNTLCRLAKNQAGQIVRGITFDVNKLGKGHEGDSSQTLNGIHAYCALDFLVEDCAALNVTNYAFWAAVSLNNTAEISRGTFRNLKTTNCHVHYEATGADNVLWDGLYAEDGDADIVCETVFHPITGSRNITYRDFYYRGSAAASIITAAAFAYRSMYGIRFLDGHVEHTAASVPVVIEGYNQGISIALDDVSGVAAGIVGMNIGGQGGTGRIDVTVNGGRYRGTPQAIQAAGNATIRLNQVKLEPFGSTGTVVSSVTFVPPVIVYSDGGLWDATGGDMTAAPGGVLGAATVVQSPPIKLPKVVGQCLAGAGDRAIRVIGADVTASAFNGVIGAGTPDVFSIQRMRAGTYRVVVEGSYSLTSTSHHLLFSTDAIGGVTEVGEIVLDSSPDGSVAAKRRAVSGSAAEGANTSLEANPVSAANAALRFYAEMTLIAQDGADFSIIGFGVDGSYNAQPCTIKAGSSMRIEQIA